MKLVYKCCHVHINISRKIGFVQINNYISRHVTNQILIYKLQYYSLQIYNITIMINQSLPIKIKNRLLIILQIQHGYPARDR